MVLVVGATGYVGRYLSVYLSERGYNVLALGRSEKVKPFFSRNGINFQYFDITNDATYKSLPTEDVEAVVCLSACIAEHETPVEQFFQVNTLGVYKLLEYCRLNDIKKFVLSSSHKVYNDINKKLISERDATCFRGDHSPYIISKIAAENFVEYYHKDFGIEGIILRFTGVHGYGEILGYLSEDGSYRKSSFEIFFENILEGKKVEVWGDQTIKRDHIYIKDVLTAIEAAIKSPHVSGVFNLATGVGHSQYEEAQALNIVFGNGKAEIELHPEKPGLTRGYIYDISKIKTVLGWTPKYVDLVELYRDYKREWETKKYRNYHDILPDQAPKTF